MKKLLLLKEKKGLPQNKKDGKKVSEKIKLQNTCYICGEEKVDKYLLTLCKQKTFNKNHFINPYFVHIEDCSKKECTFYNDKK